MRGKQSRGSDIAVIVALVTGAVLLGVILAFGALFLFRKYRSRRTHEQHILPKIAQDNASTGVSSEFLANASKFYGGQFILLLSSSFVQNRKHFLPTYNVNFIV
jgi:hypothetical protein